MLMHLLDEMKIYSGACVKGLVHYSDEDEDMHHDREILPDTLC